MAWKQNMNQRRMTNGDSAPLGTKTLRITTRVPPALNASSPLCKLNLHTYSARLINTPTFWWVVSFSCASVVGMRWASDFFIYLFFILFYTICKSQRVDKDARLLWHLIQKRCHPSFPYRSSLLFSNLEENESQPLTCCLKSDARTHWITGHQLHFNSSKQTFKFLSQAQTPNFELHLL